MTLQSALVGNGEGPQARALSGARRRRLVASAAASRTTSSRVHENEHDRNGDRHEHPDYQEPARAAPAGSHLVFTERGHVPLLPAPVESSIPSRFASPRPHSAKPRPQALGNTFGSEAT